MSTSTTWPGGAVDATPTAYAVPSSNEVNWSALSAFLNALAASAQSTTAQKWGVRKATATPVTVSATADCVVVCQLAAPAAVAVNLPAGAAKQIFVVVDGTGDAATNNITINRNGTDTIAGATSLVLSTNRETVILAYNAGDTDWKIVARAVTAAMANPMATAGDMIYGAASGVSTKLATGATAGVLHGGNAATPSWSTVVDADVSASAAIAGSKIVAATSAVAGAVTTAAQAFAGLKTFHDGVLLDDDTALGGSNTLNYYKLNDVTTTTFTFAGGGVTSSATLTISRIGRIVTLTIGACSGSPTSTPTRADTAAGALPIWASPPTTRYFPFFVVNNGGPITTPGFMAIESAGSIVIFKDVAGGTYNSGAAAGIYVPCTVTYSV